MHAPTQHKARAPFTPPLTHPPTHLSDGQIKHVAAIESDDRQGRHEESHQRQVDLCAYMCVSVGGRWVNETVQPRRTIMPTIKSAPSPAHTPTRPHHVLHLLCGAVMRIWWAESTLASFRTASHSWSSSACCLLVCWCWCLPPCLPILAPGAAAC